jgi:hypothetical protein
MSSVNSVVAAMVGILESDHGISLVNEAKVRSGEFPFPGVKAIKAALEQNDSLAIMTVVLMNHLQTEFEQQVRDTKDKNRVGFMSSQAKNGTRLAEMIDAGIDLEGKDLELALKIGRTYSKQVSVQLRRYAIVLNPLLSGLAAVFSAA